MKLEGSELLFSATDLADHLGCRHLSHLELRETHRVLAPPPFVDPALAVLQERGRKHESGYLAFLQRQGRVVTDLAGGTTEATVNAMRAGTDVIYQAPLRSGRWLGRADFLVRLEVPSRLLGSHSYEVQDTKLSRTTRASTILQLCLYSEIVENIQGSTPVAMHVVKPGASFEPESYRFQDYRAYYELVKRRLAQSLEGEDPSRSPPTYPDPVPRCDFCRWRPRCNRQRRDDDHLSLVAGMQALHAEELVRQGITTLAALGESRDVPSAPRRGHRETFERLRHQARVQLAGRREDRNVVEPRELEEGYGLTVLPEPSPGDVFFDIEGDPFIEEGGLEYLLGFALQEGNGGPLTYRSLWALDRGAEKQAFEQFVDAMMEAWRRDPGMHIYHFAHYEPSALKRLMGKHGTREREVDELLRGRRFVDLHAATRQGLRASVERYGLKELEPFFDFPRTVDLQQAGLARRRIEWALELEDPAGVLPEDRELVEGYNRDDCLATAALRDWLEGMRGDWESAGVSIPRPAPASGEASENVKAQAEQVERVFRPLTSDLPDDRRSWTAEHHARWFLAHSLDYFRRENNVLWWEFYEHRALDLEEAFADRKAVGGLMLMEVLGDAGKKAKSVIHRYAFPPQDLSVDEGDEVHLAGVDGPPTASKFGKVRAVDLERGFLDVARTPGHGHEDPAILFVHKKFPTEPLENAVLELGQDVVDHGTDAPGRFRAARDLLLRRGPRLRSSMTRGPLKRNNESAVDAALRIAPELDEGVLAIQGPPGAGKTYAGAAMIIQLARQGKRIGVTAVGNKVITNLLRATRAQASAGGALVPVAQKISGRSGDEDGITIVRDNVAARKEFDAGKVVGGTAWLWASNDFQAALDYLFVDEAGQMSLASVLAACRATRNLILLGDPAQLEQPQQGAHPEGTAVSALEHLLDGRKTMPPDRGLFLDRTWRLHPKICCFTSRLHYEDRLSPRDGLERQEIRGDTPFAGAGLFHVPVRHEGNQSSSPEEVQAVVAVVESLQHDNVTWVNDEGDVHPLTPDDVLIVAPYNAQISQLQRALPGLRIGTVDKFQGQEAPVVIYSMTTSSPEDAPRGMSFLYNPNRLNVATSRARCAVILVASPRLFEPECRTPEQMRWANGLCLFRELATEVPLAGIS